MGQGQSSAGDAPASEPAVKQDYYDLLGVERTATEEEIKKAYRRKALELHPDRNHGREEEATRLFSEIQAAHEVLADPQERAWYDSHRDILLRGEQPEGDAGEDYSYNMKLTRADEVLKLMMRFNKNVQYTDSPSGFFGGLNDFFKQLAKEEDIACQWQDLDYLEYPEFGSKDDEYSEIVKPFYGVWSSFVTKKSYSWKDLYRLSEAPDRRIRRLMEKENQKLRDEAISEYNDAVRSLVAFVRKRDTRVQNNQKSDAERERILRESSAAQAARMKARRQAELEKNASSGISAWAHTAAKDELEGGFSSDSEVEEHEFECVVCDKTFKSENQFQVHEKSKKHIKLLKELKRDMRKQGKDLDLQPSTDDVQVVGASIQNQGQDVKNGIANNTTQDSVDSDEREGEMAPTADSRDASETTSVSDLGTNNGVAKQAEDSQDDEDDYVSRDVLANRLANNVVSDEVAAAIADLDLYDTPVASGAETPSQPKKGKAKQKRARKAAQQVTSNVKPGSKFSCAVCNESFAFRNELFDHINKEGHAALKPQAQANTKATKSSKKR